MEGTKYHGSVQLPGGIYPITISGNHDSSCILQDDDTGGRPTASAVAPVPLWHSSRVAGVYHFPSKSEVESGTGMPPSGVGPSQIVINPGLPDYLAEALDTPIDLDNTSKYVSYVGRRQRLLVFDPSSFSSSEAMLL